MMENCRDCKWCFEEAGGKKLGCSYPGLCHTADGDKRGFERKEAEPLFGLGKLYVFRVEDKGKESQPLGKPITIKPGMLTYKDDEPKNEYGTKGFSTTFTGTMEEPSHELIELLTRPTLWDVKLERKPGRMPRKMKKAYEYGWLYRRDTKWKRKSGNYRRRMMMMLHDAEIVVTKEQRDRLAGMLDVEMTIKANSNLSPLTSQL